MALHFGDHFWGEGGYEAIEARLGESYKSVQALTGFFQDYVAAEAKYASKLEKILKKHSVGVNELTSVQNVWSAVSSDTQRYIDVIRNRENKIKTDVITKLGMVSTETSNAKRTAMGEAAKQLKEYKGLVSDLAKARDGYVKASVKARDSAEQLRQMTAASEKPSKIKPKEKEVTDNDAAAKKAEQAYRDALGKVTSFQPQFIQKLNQLYNEVQNQEQTRMHGVVQVILAYIETNKPLETFVKDSDANALASIKRVDIEKDVNGWIQTNKKETEPPPLPQYYAYDAPEPAPLRSSTVKTGATSTPTASTGSDRKVNFNETPTTTSFNTTAAASTISSPNPTPSPNPQGSSLNLVGNRPGGAPPAAPAGGPPKTSAPTPAPGPTGFTPRNDDLILKVDETTFKNDDDDDVPPPAAAPVPAPSTPAPAPTPAVATTPTGAKLPPGARPLFGPAVVPAGRAAGPGMGSAREAPGAGQETVPRTTSAGAAGPGGRGRGTVNIPPPTVGGPPTAGRGRGAPPPVTGAPPAAGRGGPVAAVKAQETATAPRKQSNGSFFKDLVASVDDLGGDPDSLDTGLDALNMTSFDDIDLDAPASPPPPPAGDGGQNFIGWAKAQFDYDAGDEDELSFKENDMIHLLAKDDSGWWSGECGGKIGLFPANYVSEV